MVKRKVQSKIPWKVRKKFAGKRTPYSAPKSKTMSQKYPSGYTKGSVAQQINRRHVGRTIKSVKVSPRLTKAVKQISKREAEKDLPVFTIKQVYAAKCGFAPSINYQAAVTIPAVAAGGGTTGINAQALDCQILGGADELVSVLQKATTLVSADLAECKFKLLSASKKTTYTNNTLAFIEMWVCEVQWRSNYAVSSGLDTDFVAYCTELNQSSGAAGIIQCVGVTPHISPQWKQKYISKVSKCVIPPGGQYMVSLSIPAQDVDFEQWENASTPVLPTGYKKGFTKGHLVYANYREVGNGSGTGASFGAITAGTSNQLTARVETLYKFTAPSTMSETLARNTWNFQSTGDTTALAVAGSTFDRTATKLLANGN